MTALDVRASPEVASLGATPVALDLADASPGTDAALSSALQGVDTVIHAAWKGVRALRATAARSSAQLHAGVAPIGDSCSLPLH